MNVLLYENTNLRRARERAKTDNSSSLNFNFRPRVVAHATYYSKADMTGFSNPVSHHVTFFRVRNERSSHYLCF